MNRSSLPIVLDSWWPRVRSVRTEPQAEFVRANTYYQSLILHNNAGPLGTAASLHAALAIPNVTLLEAPWANREPETDVCWPYPKIEDGYALPLEGPGLGIEFNQELASSKPFMPSLQPRLNGLDGSVQDF